MPETGRVHMAGPIRPFALCKSYDALERHTRNPGEVTCPFCSALFLADHPEYVPVTEEPEEEAMSEPEIIRAKWLMDGATTLAEAAVKLREFADELDKKHAEGWTLQQPIYDDYGFPMPPEARA